MTKTITEPHAPSLQAPGHNARLHDWLSYQERLHPRSIEMGLARLRQVAARLGLPDAGIRTLSVAGTNGKGSSATLAAGVLAEAGHRVGLYRSPHLLRYNERVCIDGMEVSDEALCRAFAAIEVARGEISLTYFEYGTLAALWLFREAGVAWQVLEVGLGGRLDAVNIVDADAALITNIGLDHQDWLGPDRETIAREKAGILRRGRPGICVDFDPPLSLASTANAVGAQWLQLGRDFSYQANEDGTWSWQGRQSSRRALPPPALAGEAQLRNAAGVLAALEALDVRLDDAAVARALRGLRLPGRFEARGRYLFDVAHNAEAGAVLADNLRTAAAESPVHLVLGMLSDKPVEAVVAALAPQLASIACAGLPPPRGLSGDELATRLRAQGFSASAHASVAAALDAVTASAGSADRILVCGSFLTVSEAQQYLGFAPAAAHG